MLFNGSLESRARRLFALSISIGLLAIISLVSVLARFTNPPSLRVDLVLIAVALGGAATSFFLFKWSGFPKVTKASEVFSISVSFFGSFIGFGSIVYLSSGVVETLDAGIWEATAGITTTAMSGLDAESLSSSMHIFRSLTQWFGGMSALCLVFIATPISAKDDIASSGYASKIFSRSPMGRTKELASIYSILTVVIFLGYWIAGMGLFDAICHSLTTGSTGGLSTKSLSIASFESAAIEWVATVGMLIGGLNIGILWWLWKRKFKAIGVNTELRLYCIIFLIASLIFWWKLETGLAVLTELRTAFFLTASLISTTGYLTISWDFASGMAAVMLIVLATGAMAGSTGGGFGMHRLLRIMKYLRREITLSYRPNAVRAIKVSGEEVEDRELDKLHGYTATFIFFVAAGAFLVSLASQNLNLEESISLSLSAFVTSGPSFIEQSSVGFEQNAVTHIALSCLMLIGRLSIFPIAYVVLFSVQNFRSNLRGFTRDPVVDS